MPCWPMAGRVALAEVLGAVGMPPEALLGLRQLPARAGMKALAHTLAYDHEVLGDDRVPAARLAKVTERVLVVDRGPSPNGMREAARAVASALPRGHLRRLTGQTHEAAPHVLEPTLMDFWRRDEPL